nr:hypothetical protein [Tanacetum cinerariifolium]
ERSESGRTIKVGIVVVRAIIRTTHAKLNRITKSKETCELWLPLLLMCERCFTRNVGPCTIKCHKCGNVGHKAGYCKEKNVATGANALPIWTCYDYGIYDDEAESSRSKRLRQHKTVKEIRVRKAGSNDEIFTYVACIRAFYINELIYVELCHEFYSTYEFDEVYADDELLGLYQAVKLEEEGFNVYFEGGLRNDEHFNAQDYWLSISREENLGLARSHTSTIRNLILRVIHKMITYGLCQRATGYDKIQKNDLWLLSMFDARHQNRVLTEDVVMSLRALSYYRDLDMITFRDLIDYDGWVGLRYAKRR